MALCVPKMLMSSRQNIRLIYVKCFSVMLASQWGVQLITIFSKMMQQGVELQKYIGLDLL